MSSKIPKGSKSSKKTKRVSSSNVFTMFTQGQIAEFKDAFQLMDQDKDGIISKEDIRATMDIIGKIPNEKELDEMIREAAGPISLTQLLGLFGGRMADVGGADDDELVAQSFKAFDESGVIPAEKFRSALMSYGDKFTAKECDEVFDAMEIDEDGNIDTGALIALLCAKGDDEDIK